MFSVFCIIILTLHTEPGNCAHMKKCKWDLCEEPRSLIFQSTSPPLKLWFERSLFVHSLCLDFKDQIVYLCFFSQTTIGSIEYHASDRDSLSFSDFHLYCIILQEVRYCTWIECLSCQSSSNYRHPVLRTWFKWRCHPWVLYLGLISTQICIKCFKEMYYNQFHCSSH